MLHQSADLSSASVVGQKHESTTIVKSRIARDFYELTKPGISQMVLMTGCAGFVMSLTDVTMLLSDTDLAFRLVVSMLGIALVSSGSCVFNHIAESEVDSQMARTSARPIPQERISKFSASVFGGVLLAVGFGLLSQINLLTLSLSIATVILYNLVYTPLKKRTTLSLIIGGIPGALPILGGWTASTNELSGTGWVLFAILFFWQMPHFLALSWMYREDYSKGGFAMTAVVDHTGKSTAIQSLLYTVLLAIATLSLAWVSNIGVMYSVVASVLLVSFLVFGLRFLRLRDVKSARAVLLNSYAFLMGFVILIIIDKL